MNLNKRLLNLLKNSFLCGSNELLDKLQVLSREGVKKFEMEVILHEMEEMAEANYKASLKSNISIQQF